jgi:hypothetical protein
MTPSAFTCTLTGVDSSTSLDEVAGLSLEFPFVEWGFLLYLGRDEGRYSAPSEIAARLERLAGNARVALHVCGREALLQFCAGEGVTADLANQVEKMSGRIQLNLRLDLLPPIAIAPALDRSLVPVIIQHNRANTPLWDQLPGTQQTLFDASGGRGVLPESWPTPISTQPFGYAGGLSPENIATELPRMAAAAGGSAAWRWIDMEGKLRVEDRFDLARCRQVLEAVKAFTETSKA